MSAISVGFCAVRPRKEEVRGLASASPAAASTPEKRPAGEKKSSTARQSTNRTVARDRPGHHAMGRCTQSGPNSSSTLPQELLALLERLIWREIELVRSLFPQNWSSQDLNHVE